jgi:glycosyltransferase involved in cell wall biosynthesis
MTAPHFLGRFGGVGVVYDCMDELANFRFAPPDITQRERFLLSKADVVFTGGYHLFRAKSQHHDNVHFFGCGVDVAHYAQARESRTSLPAEVANLSGPIAGYFGVIDERLDYELLRYLARNWAEGTIVMIGPLAKIEPGMLPRESNILWLGQRSYSDLPAFLKAFDVCLMPFALNEATQYINPTKTLEYMAAGKPIVSTAVPDVERNFAPIVEVVRSHEAFVAAVKQAFESPRLDLIHEGIRRANGASWEAIVGAMRGLMLNALNKSEAQPRHTAFT